MAMEGRLCEVMQAVGQQTLRQLLESQEGRYPAATVACACGGEAEYRYRRGGTLLTHFGRDAIAAATMSVRPVTKDNTHWINADLLKRGK